MRINYKLLEIMLLGIKYIYKKKTRECTFKIKGKSRGESVLGTIVKTSCFASKN